MSDEAPGRCEQCGAMLRQGETCEDLFNRMLALEWELIGDLRAATTQEAFLDSGIGGKYGRVHFFAVGSYQLQHPSRLRPEALIGLHRSMGEVLSGRSVADVRSENRRAYDGPRTVRRKPGEAPDEALGRWPTAWSVTVADCCDVPEAQYPAAVERFAVATVAAIDAVRSAGPFLPQPPRPAPPQRRADRKTR